MRTLVQLVLLVLVVAPAVLSSSRPAAASHSLQRPAAAASHSSPRPAAAAASQHRHAVAQSARNRRTAAGHGDASGGLLGLGLGANVAGAKLGTGVGLLGGLGSGHAGGGHSASGSASCPSADCHKEKQYCAGGLGAPPVTCCNGTFCDTENGPEAFDDLFFFNGSNPEAAQYYGYCTACGADRNCADPDTDDVDASGKGVCCYDHTCPPCTKSGAISCNVENDCLTPDTDGPSNPSSERRRRRRSIRRH